MAIAIKGLNVKGLTINSKLLLDKISEWRNIIIALLLVAALVGVIFYFAPQRGTKSFLPGNIVQKQPSKEEVSVEEPQITPPAVKTYEETAQSGEGITHLARRALKRYLEEKGGEFKLTPEHKIYIEDYIKDRTGERWLKLGETLTFSEQLIIEAIEKAQQLTPNQLKNLEQYSALVPGL